ncbi:hypothetical protein [Paenibacillus agricola]|uniref:Uncharacterized protein n=1 Tax=Paenibacillus agricola TaxID=2716264 RepID=A0ABX0JF78_9BACL|nr:hypothetical protein [Paenibacillus agricola]NHN34416.1 hypothetical protein [Paenibacillus agricola]
MPLLKEIFDWLKSYFNNDPNFGWYVIFILIVLWMYKEIRMKYIGNKKDDEELLCRTLSIYMETKLELLKYQAAKIDIYVLNEKLTRNISVFPYPLRYSINEWITSKGINSHSLQKIIDRLNDEINYLLLKQDNRYDSRNEEGIVLPTFVFIRRIFDPFFIPLFYTFLILFVIFFLGFMIIVANNGDIFTKFLGYSLIFNTIMYVIFVESSVMQLIKKRRVFSSLGYTISAGFIILSLILFIWGPWYRGLILFCLLVFYLFFFIKNTERN